MKILIVEDEKHIASLLERQVNEILSHIPHTVEKRSFLDEATSFVDNQEIDVLLLDLNLGGRDGFELLKIVSAGSFHTIVVSAYQDRAIEAFEYGVIDFVPKPFNVERLRKAFSRIKDMNNRRRIPAKYFAIRKRGRLHLIDDKDVVYFQAFGHYSKIHVKSGKSELHDKSLNKLIPILSDEYEQVHKSYIVKMSQIRDILVFEGGKYEIELINGGLIPLARSRYKKFKERWLA